MLLQKFARNPLLTPSRYGEPFREVQRVREEIDRLVDQAWRPRPTEFPPVNVWSNEDAVWLTAELPGFNSEDLDISIVQNTLTLRGRRMKPEGQENETWHRRERWFGPFVRSFELPFAVNPDHIEAEFKNGVLTIRLPRLETDKPKQITVNAS